MSAGGDKAAGDFAHHAAAVARELIGNENKHLSNARELRFGNHGSLSVDLDKGTWFDHSGGVGGGVLDLIERETGRAGRDAVAWLRENGFYVEDREPVPSHAAPAGRRGEWKPPGIPEHATLTATYDYRDASGALAYQVVRYDWSDPTSAKGHGKDFRQRRPDKEKPGGWSYKVQGVTPVPYRLAELQEAVRQGVMVFVVEGEKAADRLAALGLPATTNSGGAGKFPDALAPYFKGAKVIILPDNDDPGRKHVDAVGSRIQDVARSVRVLDLPGLPEKGDVVDWLDAGGTVDALYELVDKRARPFAAGPFESRFGAVMWGDLDAPGASYEHLVKGVLTRGEMSMCAGASGSGKTFLIVDLALSVARGVPFFGNRVRKGGVIYQAGEGAAGLRRKRLRAYRQHHACAGEDVPFVLLESPIDLYSSDDQTEAFIEECRHWSRMMSERLELVVIDTFSKATPGINENDSADVGRVLERCDRIRKATGAHVMLVHHMNAEGAKPRGHTSMLANIETVIITRKLEGEHDRDNRVIREWELAKQKEGEAGRKRKFVLPAVEIGVDEDGDPVTSCVIAEPAGARAAPEADAGIAVGAQTQVILRAIYDAAAEAGEDPPRGQRFHGLPDGGRVLSRRALAAHLRAIPLTPDDDPQVGETPDEAAARVARAREARIRIIQKTRDALYAKAVIGMSEDWLWLTGKKVRGFGPPPGVVRPDRRSEVDRDADPPAGRGGAPPGAPADDGPDPFDMPFSL